MSDLEQRAIAQHLSLVAALKRSITARCQVLSKNRPTWRNCELIDYRDRRLKTISCGGKQRSTQIKYYQPSSLQKTKSKLITKPESYGFALNLFWIFP